MDTNILRQRSSPEEVPAEPAGCFACYEGVVYIGHMANDPETGEEVEVVEAIPCRRCSAKNL